MFIFSTATMFYYEIAQCETITSCLMFQNGSKKKKKHLCKTPIKIENDETMVILSDDDIINVEAMSPDIPKSPCSKGKGKQSTHIDQDNHMTSQVNMF